PKYGALSQAVYVLLGLIGLPVFTQGGGLGYLLNATCGFLFGLIASAWVVGTLAPRSGDFKRVFLAATAGLGVLYLIGIPYLYLVLNLYLGHSMTLWDTLRAGMFLFLPGDFIKITVLAFLAKPLRRALSYF
ncbi:MAG: biotin transporter BioY, partial [Clostridia bacterium]|nr:biotin transporter BioY [Clostridia bacterium]